MVDIPHKSFDSSRFGKQTLSVPPLESIMSINGEAESRAAVANVNHYLDANDNPSFSPQESVHGALEEHIGLVGVSSHEPLNAQMCEEHPRINWFDASMHLIKGNLGPGCLNLPRAFSLSGWLLGTFLLIVVAMQGIYSMILLAELKQILLDTHHRVHTFMDVAQASLGSKGRACVEFFLFFLQTGVCCVFLDLIATNLKAQTSLSANLSIFFVACALLLVVLVRFVKNLKWLSTMANIFMMTAIITAAATAVTAIGAHNIPLPPKATSDVGDIVTFVSSMFFSFEGIGLVLPIENAFTVSSIAEEVKVANYFYRRRVLPGAMIVVGALFWVTGFFTSWGFPHIENGSVTAYLTQEFPDRPWFRVVNTMVTFAVLLTFPLQLTPALEVLERWCRPTVASVRRGTCINSSPNFFGWERLGWIIPRYCIVVGCAIVVRVVDDLGLLMTLFGAVGQTGLAMTPCLCHLALQRRGTVPTQPAKLLMNLLTVTFCTLVMFFGLITSVHRIATRNQQQETPIIRLW